MRATCGPEGGHGRASARQSTSNASSGCAGCLASREAKIIESHARRAPIRFSSGARGSLAWHAAASREVLRGCLSEALQSQLSAAGRSLAAACAAAAARAGGKWRRPAFTTSRFAGSGSCAASGRRFGWRSARVSASAAAAGSTGSGGRPAADNSLERPLVRPSASIASFARPAAVKASSF